MPYLLDSDVLIYYTNGAAHIHQLIRQLGPDGVAVSTVSYMEAQQGLYRSPHLQEASIRFDDLLARIPLIPFGPAEARRCADIREVLHRQGRRVRSRALDLMIAATALEHNLTLVTNNPADYHDVPGLLLLPVRGDPQDP